MAFAYQVVVDCSDPHRLAEWWAEVLGWEVEPQDEAFIRRMVDDGQAAEEDTMTYRGRLVWAVGAAIVAAEGAKAPGGRILFQTVPEAKTVKNRLHLDVRVGQDRIEAERDRLVGAGATYLHDGHQGPSRWFTLADPEGNEFCVT
jgi:hypothetical protein